MSGKSKRSTGDRLLAEARRMGVGPARITQHPNGTETLAWHVDDDDDRFVEVRTMRYEGSVLAIACDGYDARVTSLLLPDCDLYVVMLWVRGQCDVLAQASSPRGRCVAATAEEQP